ncbi:MAG TPA: dienelactone hydrolase [Noviherbaspirillum sp.]|uniref:alpha/beta hydrolase family protein n=1 Tax=Noviherbaspirillum sp. TaxID=1926288 RepID=UPI002B47B62E|nr:dienelactone hydrolase [Noviherbaspirillum sp.]HJV84413.1 dienelactone hydrolase [Noviherbaspirillum sp.]
MQMWRRRAGLWLSAALLGLSFTTGAFGQVGMAELPGVSGSGPVTVFYPSASESHLEDRYGFRLDVAVEGNPVQGNRRLVVISHGSPASPWVYYDLARLLVEDGFIVAMPEHFADNYKDDSQPGPPSWKRRPIEVSRAIDRLAGDTRFHPLLDLDKVGMYGMSAGGHTALTLAGGRWSPAKLLQHCEADIADDFRACAGLTTSLTGGMLDGVKLAVVRWILGFKLADTTWYSHTDPRITAIVAGVPFAADFDAASLSAPTVHLGIISARQDKWLNPKYHSDVILRTCASCEWLADLKSGGHGALLSPLPPAPDDAIREVIADPPGFERATVVPEVNRKIVAFFHQYLLGTVPPGREQQSNEK